MGFYQDQVDYQPHNFNTSTLTLNKTHIVKGLDTVECEAKEDTWTTKAVASGAAIANAGLSREGSFKFSFLEASESTDILVAAMNANLPISFTFTDSNAPNLNCSSRQAFVRKHPPIKRGKECDIPMWELVCPFMKIAGGSYAIQSAD
jgi:hypothetical protein